MRSLIDPNNPEFKNKWYMNCTKVVCISNIGFESELTVGKVYDIVGDIGYSSKLTFSPIKIVDNTGNIFNYNEERFMSLEDFRNKKLEKLGI